MNTVLTVVGNPAGSLPADIVPALTAALGVACGPAVWLAADHALDLPFDGLSPAEAESRAASLGLAADILAQPAAGRRKRLLVADMDSTMITVECIDELADFAGLKAEIAAVTERAMRGELDFEEALKARVAKLRGLDQGALQRCFDERVALMPGARPLIATMRAHGAYCALVSGGFTFFTSRVAAALGFDEHRANQLDLADGALTGTVALPIVGAATKLAALQDLSARFGLDLGQTLAVGDGANDLPMIEAAGLGVAYHAKPKVAAAARARVNHGDLTTLLYFQGFSAAEFVAGE